MQEQFYIRTAGDVVDYLVAQGLEPKDIARVIKFLPKHLKALQAQDKLEAEVPVLPESLPVVMN